ncbi:MAG: type II secretion system secretin GspD [Pseudomonadota bacterium]
MVSGLVLSAASADQPKDGGVIDLDFQSDLYYSARVITQGLEQASNSLFPSLSDEAVADIVNTAPSSGNRLLAQNDGSTSGESATAEFEIREPSQTGANENLITLNFQGADINALISLVSQVTSKSFIVDPRVKGKVTLVSGTGLPADQLYEIFLSVLEVSNFAAVPSGSVVKILPRNLVKQHPTPTSTTGVPEPSDEHITHIVTLQHASVAEILPILRPILPPTAHIAPHTGSNTMILTGTASNINRALSLIDRMDKEQRGIDIRVIYLKHADATALSQIVSQTVSALNAEAAKTGQAPANVSVQVDEGLNALIIQARETEFPVIQALIDQLDIPRPETADTHVVYLKFAQATELVQLLTGLENNNQQDESGAAPTSEVSVQADEQSNALIIRAEQEDYERILSVIEQLDIRRSQVFVETIIAEVSVNKESEIGVDWISNYRTRDGGDISTNSGFSETSGGFQVGYINRLFRNLSGNIVPNLNVILSALRGDSNTNIISTPNLLTLDNEAAEIIVGQEVPFVTGNFTTNTSSAGTSTTTDANGNTTTNTGVVNPFQTIERRDVGLTLKVTPQINDGDTIRLEIEQEVSSVSPTTVQGAADLITDTRSINAKVQVDDEQIIVLGGLIRDDSVDTHQWVPVLGKIPLIGNLFRKKRKTAVKTNLMVFLRPKIIRTPEDLALLTRDRYEFIRQEEIESLPETRRLLPDSPPQLLPQNWKEIDNR